MLNSFFSTLTGGRRALALLLLGAASTLAMPPLGIFPILALTFPALLWILDSARTRWQAFWAGWLFGWGYFVLSLYWISFSLFTDISQYWWALPFAVGGLPVLLACFTGLATLLTHISRRRGLWRIVLFAFAWTVSEVLRGHVFTGFPWNLIGYTWVDILPVLQTVALVGIYGLSFLTVLVASLPALLGWPGSSRMKVLSLTAGVALFVGLGLWGAGRMAPVPPVAGVTLRLVQAAIPQTLKWDDRVQLENFYRHIELSQAPAATPPTHILWPETAVPWTLNTHPEIRTEMAGVIPKNGLLLTGALRVDDRRTLYNSVFALNDRGDIVGSADKFHLVPFGEYLPLENLWPVKPVAANGGFGAGPGPVTLFLPGLPPVSPLVCYEVIFSGAVTAAHPRPQWLLNVTNDAWFGRSAGPHQHFAIARVRAVEEGLPLVRSANTGISAVVDPYGRVLASLELGVKGVLDSFLPQALPSTVFVRIKDYFISFYSAF